LNDNSNEKGKQVWLRLINLPLPSSTHLAPTFFARLFIMFSGFENFKDSLPLNFLLKAFQCFVERFILTNLNFWHKASLSFSLSFKGVLYALPSGCQGKQSCNLFSCNKIENNFAILYYQTLGYRGLH